MSGRERINSIIQEVKSWPSEDRAALAHEILCDLRPQPLDPPPRNTLAQARGLLRTDQPPPTDEQVEQWIEEYRMHKYGQR